ncbi:hypothetical protein ACF0H5_022469 [Mactra antiquata]
MQYFLVSLKKIVAGDSLFLAFVIVLHVRVLVNMGNRKLDSFVGVGGNLYGYRKLSVTVVMGTGNCL